MATRNTTWGYTRLRDALKNVGYDIGRTTVQRILAEHGIQPAPQRKREYSWATFIKAHLGAIAGMEFFTVESSRSGGSSSAGDSRPCSLRRREKTSGSCQRVAHGSADAGQHERFGASTRTSRRPPELLPPGRGLTGGVDRVWGRCWPGELHSVGRPRPDDGQGRGRSGPGASHSGQESLRSPTVPQ